MTALRRLVPLMERTSTRAASEPRRGVPPHTLQWSPGTAPLRPRLAILTLGSVMQTVALGLWMSAGGSIAGAQAALLSLAFLSAVALQASAWLLPSTFSLPRRGAAVLWLRAGNLMLLVALGLILVGSLWVTSDLLAHAPLDPRVYVSDAAAFNHYDAELVLRGQNPYTADGTYWDALRQFPTSAATPLRLGRYASDTWGPSQAQLVHDVRAEIEAPALRGPEFAPASLHSYPALAFLAYVPAVWAGFGSTLPVSLLALVLLLASIGRQLPARHRVVGWALLLSNGLALLLTLRGSFEALALLPAVVACQTFSRRRLSPLLLGIACAVKQIIWPMVPLYLILCWQREGWRGALSRGGIAAGAFLVCNLPFDVTTPGDWAHSLLLPVTLPLFPDGVGLVGLARGGILPLLPQAVYALLELAALAGAGVWLALKRPVPPAVVVPFLGLLPLLFAWRSLVGYFVWLPALALLAVLPLLARDGKADTGYPAEGASWTGGPPASASVNTRMGPSVGAQGE